MGEALDHLTFHLVVTATRGKASNAHCTNIERNVVRDQVSSAGVQMGPETCRHARTPPVREFPCQPLLNFPSKTISCEL